MGISIEVFQPVKTYSLSAGASSTRVQVSFNPGRRKIRIASPTGAGDFYIKMGDSTVVATTSDLLVLGGTVEIFTIDANQTHVAGLQVTTAVAVNLTTGSGS